MNRLIFNTPLKWSGGDHAGSTFVVFFLIFLIAFSFLFGIWYVWSGRSIEEPLRKLRPSLFSSENEDESIFPEDSAKGQERGLRTEGGKR